MATAKQISANRRNAKKSTGPRSARGKKSVHLNALRHGLRAEAYILPGENRDDLARLEAQFVSEYQPRGALECFLLGQMITGAWRLGRVAEVESGVFAYFQKLLSLPPPSIDDGPARPSYYDLIGGGRVPQPTPERGGPPRPSGPPGSPPAKPSPQPPPQPPQPPKPPPTLGAIFVRASARADAFIKIARYEATICRGFYRALEELQYLRAARGAPPPGTAGEAGEAE
jgi:hypothetical protein